MFFDLEDLESTTAADKLRAKIAAQHAGLVDFIKTLPTDIRSYGRIADYTVTIADLEGQLESLVYLSTAWSHAEGDIVKLMIATGDLTKQNSDDTWSGRSNDAKRAFADGRREVASDFFRLCTYRIRKNAEEN